MTTELYMNGVLRERWDGATRTYTAFDAAGVQTAQRPYDAAENALADARATQEGFDTNGQALRSRASTALGDNRTFLNLASPTNAQTLAQVKALTKQMNGLIRLTLNKLDGTD